MGINKMNDFSFNHSDVYGTNLVTTAEDAKTKLDSRGKEIREYINDNLVPEIDAEFFKVNSDLNVIDLEVKSHGEQLNDMAAQVTSYKTAVNTWDEAINLCYDYCVANKKPMYFPPFEITTSQSLEITSSVKIYGIYPLSVVNYIGTGNFIFIHDVQDFNIENLCIKYAGTDINSKGIYIRDTMHGILKDIKIDDFGYTNIHLLNGVYYVSFNNIKSRTDKGWGLILEGDSNQGPNSTTFNESCRFSGKLGCLWMKATNGGGDMNNVLFNGTVFEQDSEPGKDFASNLIQIDNARYNCFLGCRIEMGYLLGKTGTITINDSADSNAFISCAYFNCSPIYARTSRTLFFPKTQGAFEINNLLVGAGGIITDSVNGSSGEVMLDTRTPNAYYKKVYKNGKTDYAHSSDDLVLASDIFTYVRGLANGMHYTGIRDFDNILLPCIDNLPTSPETGKIKGSKYFYNALNHEVIYNGLIWVNSLGFQCYGTTDERPTGALPTGMKYQNLSLGTIQTWNGTTWG